MFKKLAVALALACASAGQATLIDFEDRGPGFSVSQTFGDYRITAPTSFAIGTSSGSNALFAPAFVPTAAGARLARVDGEAFDFVSAVLFAADGNGLGVPVSFAFVRADGSTGTYAVQTPEFGPGAPIPSTRFAFSFGGALDNVTEVRWSNGAEFHQIDDLLVEVAAAPIPEPGTWALMIAGFGAAGMAARRAMRPQPHRNQA